MSCSLQSAVPTLAPCSAIEAFTVPACPVQGGQQSGAANPFSLAASAEAPRQAAERPPPSPASGLDQHPRRLVV